MNNIIDDNMTAIRAQEQTFIKTLVENGLLEKCWLGSADRVNIEINIIDRLSWLYKGYIAPGGRLYL